MFNFVWKGPQLKQQRQQNARFESKASGIKPVKVENITLADVAGMKGEKEEVQEFINFLQNPRRYKQIGAKMPKESRLDTDGSELTPTPYLSHFDSRWVIRQGLSYGSGS